MRFLRELRGWNIRYGVIWMIQWQLNGWLSCGVHIDPVSRRVAGGRFAGLRYGPYIDLHLGIVIVSLGWRPYLSGELVNESGIARGGYSVPSEDALRVERISWSWRGFVELMLILLFLMQVVGTYMRIKTWGFP